MPEAPRDPDAHNDRIADTWGEPYGLHRVERYLQASGALDSLVDRRVTGVQAALSRANSRDWELLDHPRAYAPTGIQWVAVVVTAPYSSVAIRELGSLAELQRLAFATASELGLHVRVGHPADAIYVTARAADPTVPIVWWNPERITLDLPPIADPYDRLTED